LVLSVIGQIANAVPITVTPDGGGGISNVLFNVAGGTGTTIYGTINSDPALSIFFTAPEILVGSGGQAVLEAATGNFDKVTFGLQNGGTFTEAIFNLNATADGLVQVTVSYIDLIGLTYSTSLRVNENGQNFFTVAAANGALITQIELQALGTVEFSNIKQFRLGGAAASSSVPDGGSTLTLLGLVLIGTAVVHRTLAGKIVKIG
jgi:hypothetical protein